MRPRSLGELIGQGHLLEPGSPLQRLAQGTGQGGAGEERAGRATVGRAGPASVILWGPPGTGKTTLAHVVSRATGRRFVELSAVTAGVRDVRAVMDAAREQSQLNRRETVLFLDEIHRFTKAQQDALLPGVENRWVVLVAATTENPSFSVVAPLLSRSLVLTLRPLTDQDVRLVIERALDDERGLGGVLGLEAEAADHLVRVAGGDARRALTALEAAAGAALAAGQDRITLASAEQAIDRAAVRYDRTGDQHYDVASAFIKSLRGSDVDAALHYLGRMLEAGEDPRFIARRVMIAASEEVGMADPGALHTAVAAAQAVALIGMPEARIILAQAVVHVATAPKSNAAYLAIDAAIADVRAGLAGPVPTHLRDSSYRGAQAHGHGVGYRYAHDDPRGVVRQQYAPDAVADRTYYHPTERGAEREIATRLARLRALLRGTSPER
ncbi:MAG: replication-associated recombination protein A [Kineosporiaceae bacterium]|nr:replication-associated recombination protein A [Kineosporiaceae bacterium]